MRTFLFCLLAATLSAQTPGREPQLSLDLVSSRVQTLAEQVGPAVVQVLTYGFGPADPDELSLVRAHRGNGSGVIVDPRGYILTNAHVVGMARRVQVLLPQASEDRSRFNSVLKPSGKLAPAEVVGMDRETDIAVLRIDEKGLRHLPIGDSEQVRQGQLVFAFGSPFGLENSVSMGVVSSVARQIRPDDPMIYIQTDAAINPGNSGGPLVNAAGAVIGINSFILSQSGANSGVGFAVPGNIARTVFEQIVKYGRVKRGQIGVVAQTITPLLARALQLDRDWGVIVSDVASRSAAESAGLQIKDIVLSIDGKPVENARQFGVNIYQRAGDTMEVAVLRGGREVKLKVAVLERPKDPDRMYSLVSGEQNVIARLGIIALDLDEKVTPFLPPFRRLSGVVVAGRIGVTADHGSFQNGDVIYEVNNQPVGSVAELKAVLAKLKHGDPAAVLLERSGQLQFIELEVE
ncbi:MAG: trypsin-like peptidase domain-containing protein [Bryobacterales bacterium]|nr:trypsin-like peptidase domain-containing protein [Bryobacterales bacterium]